MWKSKAGPQHEILEDNSNSVHSADSPSVKRPEFGGYVNQNGIPMLKEISNIIHSADSPSMKQPKFGGYVDQNGIPNPLYVASVSNKRRNHDGDQTIESVVAQQQLRNQRRLHRCIDFFSDLSFFFGSFMYLWLSLSESKDVLIANDDDDGSSIFLEFDDDYGEFFEDTLISKDVSLYMVYGITSGLLMLAAGVLRLYSARTPSDRVPYAFMVLASFLAIVSSSLVRKSPFGSDTCFSVSIHFYSLQAATLLLWRFTQSSSLSSAANRRASCLRLSGDALFFAVTLVGIVFSYLRLFDATHVIAFSHEYLAISFAGGWCLSSFLYLLQTSCELVRQRATDEDDDYESYCEEGFQKSLPQEDTPSTDEEDLEKAVVAIEADPIQVMTDPSEKSTDERCDPETNETTNDSCLHNDEEKSVFTAWTDGPGPAKKEHIAKSSLDDIFGMGLS